MIRRPRLTLRPQASPDPCLSQRRSVAHRLACCRGRGQSHSLRLPHRAVPGRAQHPHRQGPAIPPLRRRDQACRDLRRGADPAGAMRTSSANLISGFRRTSGSASSGPPPSLWIPRLLSEPATPRRALGRAGRCRAVAQRHGARSLSLAGAAPAPRVIRATCLHPVDGAQGPVRLALWPDGQFQAGFPSDPRMVLSQYRGARLELDDRGMTLRNSPPPVKGRVALISKA